jgi:hypothetical protein
LVCNAKERSPRKWRISTHKNAQAIAERRYEDAEVFLEDYFEPRLLSGNLRSAEEAFVPDCGVAWDIIRGGASEYRYRSHVLPCDMCGDIAHKELDTIPLQFGIWPETETAQFVLASGEMSDVGSHRWPLLR